MNDLVSVIMPTWNRRYCIEDAINSVYCQSYHNWELIIIDDGSQDDTKKITETLTGNIIYSRTEHIGVAHARNIGLELSRGKYISFLDSDNTYYNDFLLKMVEYLKKQSDFTGGVHCKTRVTNYDGHNGLKYLNTAWSVNEFHLHGDIMDINSTLSKSEAVKYYRFNENMTRLVDYEFLLRVCTKWDYAYLDDLLVDYNRKKDSITLTEPQKGNNWSHVWKAICEYERQRFTN